jgi:hypothetical protein
MLLPVAPWQPIHGPQRAEQGGGSLAADPWLLRGGVVVSGGWVTGRSWLGGAVAGRRGPVVVEATRDRADPGARRYPVT